MAQFAGTGGAAAANNYTWGGDPTKRRVVGAVGTPSYDGVDGMSYQDTINAGYTKSRDDATGEYLWTKAGEMKALDTSGAAMTKTDPFGGGSVPTAGVVAAPAGSQVGAPAPAPAPAPAAPQFAVGGTPTGTTPATPAPTPIIPPAGAPTPAPAGVAAPPPIATAPVAYDQTTEGIISRIAGNKNAPINQRAMAIAAEEANRRGLQSSTIATDGAVRAVIDQAIPIAQADANIYAGDRQRQSAEAIANANMANQRWLQTSDNEAKIKIAEINKKLDTDSQKEYLTLQASLNATATGRTALTTLTSRYADAVQQVRLNPDLDAETKAGVIADLRNDWIAEGNRMAAIYGITLPPEYMPQGE